MVIRVVPYGSPSLFVVINDLAEFILAHYFVGGSYVNTQSELSVVTYFEGVAVNLRRGFSVNRNLSQGITSLEYAFAYLVNVVIELDTPHSFAALEGFFTYGNKTVR